MQPWEKYQAAGETGPWTKYESTKEAGPPTLQERSKDIYGFKDYEYRGALLPMGRTKEGKTELAVPGVIKDLAESALLPGHVYKGGTYSAEDALKFTLDYTAPATAGRGVGGAPPVTKTRRDLRMSAPTQEQLKQQARSVLTDVKGTGARVSPDSFLDMVAKMETTVTKNKLNQTLHPRAFAAFKVLSESLGKDFDVEDLMVARRLIDVAKRTTAPEFDDERRIAGIMTDLLDDFVDNLKPDDLVSGALPEKIGPGLKEFRSLWSRAKKVDTIEGIVEKATTQASGFENVRANTRAIETASAFCIDRC